MDTNFDLKLIDSCVSLSKKVQEEFRPVVKNLVLDVEDELSRDNLWIVSESIARGMSVWNDSTLILPSYNKTVGKELNTTGYHYFLNSFCRYFPEFTQEAFDSLVVLSCVESLYDFACDILARGSKTSVSKAMEIEHLLTDLYTEYKDEWDNFTDLQKQIADVFVNKKYYGFISYCSIVSSSTFWNWAVHHALVTKSVRKNGMICYKAVSDGKTRDYKSLVTKGLGSLSDFGLLTFVANIFVRWYVSSCNKFNIVMDECGGKFVDAIRNHSADEIITDVVGAIAKSYVGCEGINSNAFEKFQNIGLFAGLNYRTATGKQVFDAVRFSLRGFENFETLVTIADVIDDPIKALNSIR